MLDRILEFLSGLGLPGVFAGVFFEAIGLPFPGSVLVAWAGFLTNQGKFNIITAWLVSLLGYLLGSFSAFMIGRYMEGSFSNRWRRYVRLTPERLAKAQKLLQKSAPVYIIGGRFLPTIGNVTPYIAGISGVNIGKFLIYDLIHAILWLTIFLGAGAVLGSRWRQMTDNPWLKWVGIGGGLVLLVYLLRDFFPGGDKNKE